VYPAPNTTIAPFLDNAGDCPIAGGVSSGVIPASALEHRHRV
jgi:hypothetical protein